MLLAIERTGSLSRAAEQLGTDQPHVSRLLRRIEDHLGHPVFHRGPHGAEPTAAGAAVLDRARHALTQLERLRHPLSGAAPGRIRLITHRFDGRGLAEHIGTAAPELDVAQHGPALPDEAFRTLIEGTADVFVAGRLPHVVWPVPDGVALTEVATVPTAVLLPREHPGAGAAEIELCRLVGATWAIGLDGQEEPALREECERTGGFVPRIGYRRLSSWNLEVVHRIGHAVQLVCPYEVPPEGVHPIPVLGAGATTVVVGLRDADAPRLARILDAVRGFGVRRRPDPDPVDGRSG